MCPQEEEDRGVALRDHPFSPIRARIDFRTGQMERRERERRSVRPPWPELLQQVFRSSGVPVGPPHRREKSFGRRVPRRERTRSVGMRHRFCKTAFMKLFEAPDEVGEPQTLVELENLS